MAEHKSSHGMTNMKLSKSERKERRETLVDDGPEFPFGLSIHLDDESLEKLDMKKLPPIGTEMTLTAKVKVTDISAHDSENGKDRSVGFQITDMALHGKARDGEEEAAEVFFGK